LYLSKAIFACVGACIFKPGNCRRPSASHTMWLLPEIHLVEGLHGSSRNEFENVIA
jgi:hypothetical protein